MVECFECSGLRTTWGALPEGLISGEEVSAIHTISFARKWRIWSSSRHWFTAEINRESGWAIPSSRGDSGQSAPCSDGELSSERKLLRLALTTVSHHCQFQAGTTCGRALVNLSSALRVKPSHAQAKECGGRSRGKRLTQRHRLSTSCRSATDEMHSEQLFFTLAGVCCGARGSPSM